MAKEGLCRVLLPPKAPSHGVQEEKNPNPPSQGVREHVAFVGTGINLHYLYY